MHIQGLEVALRKHMVPVFRQKGLSAEAADAKATTHMVAASTLFHEKLDEDRSQSEARVKNPVDQMQYAMRQVVVWAHTL